MEDEDIMIEESEISEDISEEKEEESVDSKVGSLYSFVRTNFVKAEKARYTDEGRMLQAYRNYRGIYDPSMQFTETEKSRVFVKVTKTKVLAAYGQLTDVLFGNNKFPISVKATSEPEGIPETVHFLPGSPEQGAPSEAPESPTAGVFDVKPGEGTGSILQRLHSAFQKKLEPVASKLKEGPGTTPDAITFHPADHAAEKMQKRITDQIEESNGNKHLRMTVFECVLFGSGVMKGPFVENKEYPSWTENGDYEPVVKKVPRISTVSIWNFYPDPDANNMDEVEYCVERHKMSRSGLRALKRRPHFRSDAIDLALMSGPDYQKPWWEDEMQEADERGHDSNRYEVLEYWGYVDRDVLEEHGVEIPEKFKQEDQLSVNVWIVAGEVIRVVMNPFQPMRIPYYVVPFEMNPYSFIGVGLAENMDDTQTLMNGFMRMAVDNMALSGNLIIEIDESALVAGQDLTVYPGKVFVRQDGAPGQAIFGTEFPNVAAQNMQLFDKVRQLADESTGMPSFAHGQTGVQGVGRTASGISMLMGAANGGIRTVVKNFDDYLLGPMGRALYFWNKQFDFDKELHGDFEVVSQGTESLISKEIRSQRLMQFLQTVQNPVLAPFAKMDYIIREIAKALELDPDKVTNNLADAAVQAEVLKAMQAEIPQEPGNPAAPGGLGLEAGPGSGGGVPGIGNVPNPGEQGFAANTGEGQQV